MPVISVEREHLFAALGQTYTEEEFDQLCFDFGIELDEVVTKGEVAKSRELSEELSDPDAVVYKIDLPANRYDLLCLEGLARALLVFLEKQAAPVFKVIEPSAAVAAATTMTVKPSTKAIRPFVVCAVLRGIALDQRAYNSFLDLQDHLHRNICRRRTLVAIGTHDLDKLQGPFTYEGLPPSEIHFKHLFADKAMGGKEMMDWFREDPKGKHIKPYTDIIYDSPVYPVIMDANRTVLSLPPIINGKHSEISKGTKNIFIECTCTDLTKGRVVLSTVVAMFSRFCAVPDSVEPVNVVYEEGCVASMEGTTKTYPDMENRSCTAGIDEMCSIIGADLSPEQVVGLCSKMQLGPATHLPASAEEAAQGKGKGSVRVSVPPTRSDILHPVDVVEDVAIAYGFNNLALQPAPTSTTGRELPINQLSDLLRYEVAQAGFTEILSLGLCSHDENFKNLRQEDDGKSAVVLSNPKTIEFQVVRTSLLPGMLKTLAENRSLPVKEGIRLFEISDILLLDEAEDTGCKNHRRLAALFTGPRAGFEVIHGLVDRVMQLLSHSPAEDYSAEGAAAAKAAAADEGAIIKGSYKICGSDDRGMFFTGRGARIEAATNKGEMVAVGCLGVLHPAVLKNFGITNPCSVLELDLDPFL